MALQRLCSFAAETLLICGQASTMHANARAAGRTATPLPPEQRARRQRWGRAYRGGAQAPGASVVHAVQMRSRHTRTHKRKDARKEQAVSITCAGHGAQVLRTARARPKQRRGGEGGGRLLRAAAAAPGLATWRMFLAAAKCRRAALKAICSFRCLHVCVRLRAAADRLLAFKRSSKPSSGPQNSSSKMDELNLPWKGMLPTTLETMARGRSNAGESLT